MRAPFIWTPRQPIAENHLTALRDLPERDDGKNRWFLFRRTFDLPEVPADAPTHMTVDGRYILYINGTAIGRGPVRCSPLAQRYDSYDIAPHLRPGRNVAAVLVHCYGVDTAFHEAVRGLWHPVFGEGGLWVDGEVLNSRQAWRCIESDAWERDVPQSNHSLGFIEWLDARRLDNSWIEDGFDDSAWDVARELVAGGGGAESLYQGLTVRPFPILRPRGIPQLREAFVRPVELRWVMGQRPNTDLGIETRLYDEALVPAIPGAATDIEGLCGGSGPARVFTFPNTDTAFTFDFGRIFSGYPAIEIEARGGEIIEIACSERLPGEWFGEVAPDARIERRPYLGTDAHICRYVAKPGVQYFQRFEWCAIRYMHVVVRGAPGGLTIRRLGAVETHYPAVQQGRFDCSDAMLTKLWAAGAYTLRQCMHDAWEDCPSREQRQWLGDVTVENLAGWAAFGSSAAPLTAKYLIQAAESQRSDGLTQMFAPGDHGHNARLIPDWTLQWILCAADHWMLTGDRETIEEIWPSIEKALQWFARVAGDGGRVADMPYWHFMDWAGLGRDHQALALNAQLAGACRAAAILAAALDNGAAAVRYERRAAAMIAALDVQHWDEERGTWVDMVDPASGRKFLRTSQHGAAALALWGDPSSARVARALDWSSDPSRITQTPAPPVVPFGTTLDLRNGVAMANTFYSHFVGEALAKHGRRSVALSNIRNRFGGMVDKGSTTLWEATTPWASLCHGFSASPTWFLSRHLLGVAPAEAGFDRTSVSPDIMGLDHAKGIVGAGLRELEIELERSGDGFVAMIAGADETVTVEPPVGLELASIDRRGGRVEARFVTPAA